MKMRTLNRWLGDFGRVLSLTKRLWMVKFGRRFLIGLTDE